MIKWRLPEADTYFGPMLKATPDGFELDHLHYALQHVRRFTTAIDGGAHVGTWTSAMSSVFKSVIAFEPARDTYDCLASNISSLQNVRAYRVALGSFNGTCVMEDDPTRVGNTGSRTVGSLNGGTGDTPMAALDSFVQDLPADLQDIGFLKLDLEGYEIEALKGAVDTIQRCSPTILVECKKFNPPRYGGPEVVIKFLTEQLGYRQVGGVRNDQVFVR